MPPTNGLLFLRVVCWHRLGCGRDSAVRGIARFGLESRQPGHNLRLWQPNSKHHVGYRCRPQNRNRPWACAGYRLHRYGEHDPRHGRSSDLHDNFWRRKQNHLRRYRHRDRKTSKHPAKSSGQPIRCVRLGRQYHQDHQRFRYRSLGVRCHGPKDYRVHPDRPR